MHWALATPFLLCYVSALLMALLNTTAIYQSLRAPLSWTHRTSGLCLVGLPFVALILARKDFRVYLRNIKEACTWRLDDVRWIWRAVQAAMGRRVSLPEQGKFNAGQKLNFLLVMGSYPLYVVTGLIIWLPGVGFYSWIAHYALAVIGTPFLLGHLYMATLHPRMRKSLQGMISGYVDREWAKEQFRRWYRETYGGREESGELDPGVSPLQLPALVRCRGCQAVRAYQSWEWLIQRISRVEPPLCPKCLTALLRAPGDTQQEEVALGFDGQGVKEMLRRAGQRGSTGRAPAFAAFARRLRTASTGPFSRPGAPRSVRTPDGSSARA